MLALYVLNTRSETPEVIRRDAFYEIDGRTFPEIRREIIYRSPKRMAIAWCSWNVTWNIHAREKANRCEIDYVDTRATISITMPRWVNYASAGDGMKAAWDQYSGAILAHEETHASHGIAAANEIQRLLPDLVGGMSSCNSVREEAGLLANRIIKENREKDVKSIAYPATISTRLPTLRWPATSVTGCWGGNIPPARTRRSARFREEPYSAPDFY